MRTKLFLLLHYALLLSACSTQSAQLDLPLDHPANPLAPSSPPLAQSTTLDIVAAESREPAEADSPKLDSEHGKPASPKPAPKAPNGAPLFACPMHPEVTSADPSALCPKCNMKIDEPLKSPGDKPGDGDTTESHGGHSE